MKNNFSVSSSVRAYFNNSECPDEKYPQFNERDNWISFIVWLMSNELADSMADLFWEKVLVKSVFIS